MAVSPAAAAMRGNFISDLQNEESAMAVLISTALHDFLWGTVQLKICVHQKDFDHSALAYYGKTFLHSLGYHVKSDTFERTVRDGTKIDVNITDVCFIINWDWTRDAAILG
jgi:hypothetical protein